MYDLKLNNSVFESIKHVDENGHEFWLARELMPVLEYDKWQRFKEVISKAIKACESSNYIAEDHFTGVGKMIKIAKGGQRKINDYKLSRYACYLIAQNDANSTHYKVGAIVRKTIKELGGTMPENLSTPEKSLKELTKEKNSLIK